MAEHYRPPKRAQGRWGDAETAALIEAWEPIYRRRRDGEGDLWVPACRLDRVRSSRRLVAEDRRVVATAVNACHDSAGLGSLRTGQQCRSRFDHLASTCWKDDYSGAPAAPSSSRRFFTVLRGVLSPSGTGQPTGQVTPVQLHQQMETVEAAQQEDDDDVVLDDGSAANAGNPINAVEVEVERPAEQQDDDIGNGETEVDTRGPIVEDGRVDTAGYAGVRRSDKMAGLWGCASHIPKRLRSFGSTSGSANLRGGTSADGIILESFADLLGSASAKGAEADVSATASVAQGRAGKI